MMGRISRAKEWYEHNERRVSSGSLVLGFVVDSITLQRIDNPRENIWIIFNLLLVATIIVLLNRQENDKVAEEDESRRHFWLTTILQFSFGALFGAFFVFYFRSATLAAAWPFLFILLLAMVANELFQKKYARLVSQISFFYLSLFLFFIFLVPVLLHRIGALMFILSGALSLGVLWFFLRALRKFANERFIKSREFVLYSVGGIFVAMNFLYFTNLIPPIPLALKDAGVYHSINRTSDGYSVLAEDHGFLGYLRLRDRFHTQIGGTAYAYSAIFSPAELSTQIVHEWQYKNSSGDWVTSSRINLSVSGGREEGFRTFSQKTNLSPGDWRVNVATPRGQLIGRINLKVTDSADVPELVREVKD